MIVYDVYLSLRAKSGHEIRTYRGCKCPEDVFNKECGLLEDKEKLTNCDIENAGKTRNVSIEVVPCQCDKINDMARLYQYDQTCVLICNEKCQHRNKNK